MGWLPITVLLGLGIVALVLLLVGTLAAANRARRASRTLSIAVAGRSNRLRAGVAELTAWREAHRAGRGGRADLAAARSIDSTDEAAEGNTA